MSKDSLRGENSQGRLSGARSSRVPLTIFNRLRKLDRQIAEIDNRTYQYICLHDKEKMFDNFQGKGQYVKLREKRNKLDEKRKKVRNLRKYYRRSK